jgi:uncharacterized protein YhfF
MTSSAVIFYQIDGEEEPTADGAFDIVLNSKNEPVAVVQNVKILRNNFYDVPVEVAVGEGEGDKTLDYWRRVHEAFWKKEFEGEGIEFDLNKLEVLTEVFRVVYEG